MCSSRPLSFPLEVGLHVFRQPSCSRIVVLRGLRLSGYRQLVGKLLQAPISRLKIMPEPIARKSGRPRKRWSVCCRASRSFSPSSLLRIDHPTDPSGSRSEPMNRKRPEKKGLHGNDKQDETSPVVQPFNFKSYNYINISDHSPVHRSVGLGT